MWQIWGKQNEQSKISQNPQKSFDCILDIKGLYCIFKRRVKFLTQIKFTWFSFFIPSFCGKNWCLLLTVFAIRFKKCFRSRQAWDGVNCLFLFKHFFESLFSFASIFLNFNAFLGNLSKKNLTFLLTMVLLERNQWLVQKIVTNIPTYDECHCGKLLQFF